MNNFIYKELVAYENNVYTIEKIFFDNACEADTVSSVDDAESKRNFAQRILDKVKKLIKELYAIIDRQFSKIMNIIKRVLQSDEGFKKKARDAIRKNKPLEAIKLIAYQYNNSALDNNMRKLSSTLDSIIDVKFLSNVKDEGNPLDMKSKDMIIWVFNKAGIPKEVTDVNLLFEYLKKIFRVAKKEQLFKASETKLYYDVATKYDVLAKDCNEKNNKFKSGVTNMKAILYRVANNSDLPDEDKRKILCRAKGISQLTNLYLSILSIYSQLKIEQALSHRIVLQKLYHF